MQDHVFKYISLAANVYIWNYTEIHSWDMWESDWCEIRSIGSGDGLAPNRWQAITWINLIMIQFINHAHMCQQVPVYC